MDKLYNYASKNVPAFRPKELILDALGSEKLAQDVLYSSNKTTVDVIKTNEDINGVNTNIYHHTDLIWKRENQKDINIDIKLQDIYNNTVSLNEKELILSKEIYLGIFVKNENNIPRLVLTNKNLLIPYAEIHENKNYRWAKLNVADIYKFRSWDFGLTEDQRDYYNLIYNDWCKVGHIKDIKVIQANSPDYIYQQAVDEVLKVIKPEFIKRYNLEPVFQFI